MQATIKKVQVECGKCNGTGNIQAFRHIEKGDCFACCGEGKIWICDEKIADNASQIDADLDIRRREFFAKMTLAQFKSLTKEKRDSVAKWVDSKYFSEREIHDRFMSIFQPTWLAMM